MDDLAMLSCYVNHMIRTILPQVHIATAQKQIKIKKLNQSTNQQIANHQSTKQQQSNKSANQQINSTNQQINQTDKLIDTSSKSSRLCSPTIPSNMSDPDENYSDVSLDEEDEELIWRVFYSPLEEKKTAEHPERQDDEDVSDLSDIDDAELVAKYQALKSQENRPLTEDEKRRLLITSFTEDQMERFEAYRRMTVNKPGVKKVCNSVLGHSIPQNIAVVMAGLSKLLLGDIITRAFEVQERENKAQLILDIEAKKRSKREVIRKLAAGEDITEVPEKKLYSGDVRMPLQPDHIREAWRLYRLENSGTFLSQWRTLGEGDGKMFR